MTDQTLPAPSPGALAGVRVIEMGQLIAGPFAGKTLGRFRRRGHQDRAAGRGRPAAQVAPAQGRHFGVVAGAVAQQALGRARPAQPRGAGARAPLAAEADVLIENFRPGTLEGWGLGRDALHAAQPAADHAAHHRATARPAPTATCPGFGVVAEAMGGLRHLTGEPGRVPVRVGVSIGDTLAALHGVIGVLVALHHRQATGGAGQVIDVALYEAVFNCMESLLPEYSAFGAVREAAGSALPGIAPTQRLPLQRWRLRADRRQRRQHFQAPDGGHRPRRSRRPIPSWRQRRPRGRVSPRSTRRSAPGLPSARVDEVLSPWTRPACRPASLHGGRHRTKTRTIARAT